MVQDVHLVVWEHTHQPRPATLRWVLAQASTSVHCNIATLHAPRKEARRRVTVTARRLTARRVTARRLTARRVTARRLTARRVTARRRTARCVTARRLIARRVTARRQAIFATVLWCHCGVGQTSKTHLKAPEGSITLTAHTLQPANPNGARRALGGVGAHPPTTSGNVEMGFGTSLDISTLQHCHVARSTQGSKTCEAYTTYISRRLQANTRFLSTLINCHHHTVFASSCNDEANTTVSLGLVCTCAMINRHGGVTQASRLSKAVLGVNH